MSSSVAEEDWFVRSASRFDGKGFPPTFLDAAAESKITNRDGYESIIRENFAFEKKTYHSQLFE